MIRAILSVEGWRHPGSHLLTKGGVERRNGGNPELRTNLGKVLIVGREKRSPSRLCEVLQDGVREVQSAGIGQTKNRRDVRRIEFEQGDRKADNLCELPRGKGRRLAIDLGQHDLGSEENTGSREPPGMPAQQMLTCRLGGVALEHAVNEDHRVQPALPWRVRRGGHRR